MFSFHPVKAITTGEGGMVTTRDERLRDRLAAFRTHGIVRESSQGGWFQEQRALAFNYRLSDIHAALGRSQLRRLERFIEDRNAVADRYREALSDVSELELAPAAPPTPATPITCSSSAAVTALTPGERSTTACTPSASSSRSTTSRFTGTRTTATATATPRAVPGG